jgi:hypothetical protein
MAKKIYGDLSSTGNIQVNDSNTIREINGLHADTSGDINLPYYEKTYIENIISMCPVTRIGTLDYLPLNVGGSYVGATTSASLRGFPTILENDGTMVILRPGTNGSSQGFYYCYIKNARNVNTLTPIQTNLEYLPSIFTSLHSISDFIASKSNEVLMMQTFNGTEDTYTIALTNGTFNQVSHEFVEFNRSLIPNTTPNYVHIVDGLIYIWCINSTIISEPYNISLYTISTSDVINGVTTSLKLVSGISGKNLYGSNVTNSNTIKITDTICSTNSDDHPLILQDASLTVTPFYVTSYGTLNAEPDVVLDNIRVSVIHRVYSQSAFGGDVITYGLSFSYNKNSKVYTFDTKNAGPITIRLNGSSINSTNPYNFDLQNYNGFGNSIHSGTSLFQTDDGVVFSSVARFVTGDYFTILRCKLDNFTNNYDSLNLSTRKTSKIIYSYVYPQYGSAIGSNLLNPTILSSNKILMSCAGTENDVTFGYDNKVYTDLGNTRDYVYNSVVSDSTITGYAPNSNRHKIDNSDYRYSGLIQLIDANGNVSVYGSTFLEGNSKPVNGLMNINNFTFNTNYTLQSSTILTNLKNSIISSVTYPGTITDSRIVLYYVPDSSFGSSIAITTIITSTKDGSGYNGFVIVSKVNVSLSGSTVTSMSVTYNNIMGVSSSALEIDYSYITRMTGLVIAKYSGFSYIGIPAICNIKVPGNASFRSVIGKLDTSNNFVSMTAFTSYFLSTGNTYEVGVIPGVGFGLYTNNLSDLQTKLVFKSSGTSSANLDSLIANPTISGTNIVIASQDVPKGFNVYFSQTVPVLINGSYYTIPATTIDLNTIDSAPANKTFYVYVFNLEGTASYQLSTTLLSEELWRVYIGSVVTGASSISTVSIEKVTRFLTYRTSTTKRGSAIPTSTGVPSSTGTRWH